MTVRAKNKQMQKNDGKKGNTQNFLLWGAGILGVLALGGLLFLAVRGPAAPQDIEGIVTTSGQSREHVEDDHHDEDDDDDHHETAVSGLPPMGGSHSAAWQNCGIYDEPINASNATHSLEHGAVWIAYQPDLAENDVTRLQDMARGESHILLAPFPNLKSPVVLTAWGVQLETDSAKDGRVSEFIEEYQQGSQTPEPGAVCSDGVGTPIQ